MGVPILSLSVLCSVDRHVSGRGFLVHLPRRYRRDQQLRIRHKEATFDTVVTNVFPPKGARSREVEVTMLPVDQIKHTHFLRVSAIS